MDDRDRAHLEALVLHAQVAIRYARDRGRGWWKSPETVDAVLMRITQVGEQARRVPAPVLAMVADVDWPGVKEIRSKIVHDYRTIDLLVIRGVVARQLPDLVVAVQRGLGEQE